MGSDMIRFITECTGAEAESAIRSVSRGKALPRDKNERQRLLNEAIMSFGNFWGASVHVVYSRKRTPTLIHKEFLNGL